ncbi:MAG: ferrochelatase [Deltaproteobacteria bacterium]|nr:ferrochelatase [Deltaproteobacteria bacterium]
MTGVLLINLGTPNAPDTKSVRRYLRLFLSDPYVIDINPVLRWILVNLFIVPFRSPKSALAYKKIWTEEGSPLLINTLKLAKALQEKLGRSHAVQIGMRYGEPSIRHALWRLNHRDIDRILVLPLYPQYASSSTKTCIEEVKKRVRKLGIEKPLEFFPPFFDHPGFIHAFAEIGRPYVAGVDHVLFSFHGLPERHIQKGDPYRDQCFVTAEALAKGLNLEKEKYSVSFQSRLGRTPWIKPYTDVELVRLACEGKKRLAVFCPAFVADCLETLEEIAIRGKESFLSAGGESLQLIPSLNDHPAWVEALTASIRERSQPAP